MTKEKHFKYWTAYVMTHKWNKPILGFQVGSTRIDIDLIYVSFGLWR